MSETGFTSLILAAAGGHLEVVKTLVEKVRSLISITRCVELELKGVRNAAG